MKAMLLSKPGTAESRPLELTDHALPEPGVGQVRLRVERYSVTANTVTYAVTGDVLGYWGFFPGHDPGWGRGPGGGAAALCAYYGIR
jgi:NADPH:quinone reductase-like Zn-dependent oxidoreductase